MKILRIASSMIALSWLALSVPGTVSALIDSGQKELSSLPDGKSAEFVNRDETGIGFDISGDIKRGQEFLKDKTAGYSVTLQEKKVLVRTRKGGIRVRVVCERS